MAAPALPEAVLFLGNPGRDYAKTRHNAGFMVSECWEPVTGNAWQSKFKGLWMTTRWQDRKVILLKPQVFMNLSGESARAASDFLKVPPEHWLVVHDDLEVPFGEIRLQIGGGLGGHNGLKSLKQHWGTDKFARLRFGLGRPVHLEVADFVLSRFSPAEEIQLGLLLPMACRLLEGALSRGIPEAKRP
ncbi:MAG: aminoacyl-tRNA hydrolase [Spirochaetales bacterium]